MGNFSLNLTNDSSVFSMAGKQQAIFNHTASMFNYTASHHFHACHETIPGLAACEFPGESLSQTEMIIHASATAVLAVSSLVCNILVFILFYNRRILLTISNRFVVNLAVSNLLLTVTLTPSVLVSMATGRWALGHVWCIISAILTTTLIANGIFTLVLISLDRYLAVSSPLRYRLLMTVPRSGTLICGAWLFAIALGLPPTFGWSKVGYQRQTGVCTVYWQSRTFMDVAYTVMLLILCCVGPLVIMLWVYGKMFSAAKRTSARARQNSITPDYLNDTQVNNTPVLHSSASTPTLTQLPTSNLPRRPSSVSLLSPRRPSSTSLLTNGTRRRSSINMRLMSAFLVHRDDRKAVRTGVVVISTFVLCWVCYFVHVAVTAFAGGLRIPGVVNCVAVWLALLSCSLNPVVYVFRNKTVRNEMKNILMRRTSTLQVLDFINGRENGESRRGSRELTKSQLHALYSVNMKTRNVNGVIAERSSIVI